MYLMVCTFCAFPLVSSYTGWWDYKVACTIFDCTATPHSCFWMAVTMQCYNTIIHTIYCTDIERILKSPTAFTLQAYCWAFLGMLIKQNACGAIWCKTGHVRWRQFDIACVCFLVVYCQITCSVILFCLRSESRYASFHRLAVTIIEVKATNSLRTCITVLTWQYLLSFIALNAVVVLESTCVKFNYTALNHKSLKGPQLINVQNIPWCKPPPPLQDGKEKLKTWEKKPWEDTTYVWMTGLQWMQNG